MKAVMGPALAALVLLAGCATSGRADQAAVGTCRPDAARLVGQTAPDDAEILRRTGSVIVRRLAPGDMATKD